MNSFLKILLFGELLRWIIYRKKLHNLPAGFSIDNYFKIGSCPGAY